MTEKNNLILWNKVEKTNPNYTKNAKVGGMKITSIAPQYQIMQVTEQFGVYGETWGFRNIELSYDLVEKFNMVVFKGTFFFPEGEFEIINSCKLYMDRNLTMVDDNFAKKIETDSLTKAISKLGFNADIFLGKFDDQRYLDEVTQEFKEPEVVILPPFTPNLKMWNQAIEKKKSIEEMKEHYSFTPEDESKYVEQLNSK